MPRLQKVMVKNRKVVDAGLDLLVFEGDDEMKEGTVDEKRDH